MGLCNSNNNDNAAPLKSVLLGMYSMSLTIDSGHPFSMTNKVTETNCSLEQSNHRHPNSWT